MSGRTVTTGGSRIGCDVAMVGDVDRSIERFGERYLRRVFTEREVAECAGPIQACRLAARFAAKEAVMKVLRPSDDAVPWTNIEVRRASWGGCVVELSGSAARLAAQQGVGEVQISISHDGGVAVAMATAVVLGGAELNRGEWS
ncbi:holo-ACP synthase [Rhodococcus sp. ABRD24]|uniref:holo-ACP synthase n=1 Tax=Rhodococcus sp. ABRD24 TaxID=2507582 RepID=UPI00103F12E0|nr:holo-ACP synthase [Rhodococcus sp. ABRD24]QBJ97625.1 holo-ACP synthase [Rhodococcus sp. ABRD24]